MPPSGCCVTREYGPVERAYAGYAAQVLAYGGLLERAGVAERSLRSGLLFTADGVIRWVGRTPSP